MPLICVCSPKGGVGKTTLAANLAYSLARTGSKVLALDFDVQNALRLHFGVPLNDDMVFFDDENVVHRIVTGEEHGFHEGSSLRKRNGIYY